MTIFSYQTNIHRLVTSHCRTMSCYSMVCRLLDFLIKKPTGGHVSHQNRPQAKI